MSRIFIRIIILVLLASLLFGIYYFRYVYRQMDISIVEEEWQLAPDSIDELEGVSIEAEYDVYETDTITLRIKWSNTIQDEIMYGRFFLLEKLVNDEWRLVSKETDIEYAFESIGFILKPNDAEWKDYNFLPYTDGLSEGEYRINTKFSRIYLNGIDYGAGNYPEYQLYAYFRVIKEDIKDK